MAHGPSGPDRSWEEMHRQLLWKLLPTPTRSLLQRQRKLRISSLSWSSL